MRNRCRTAGVRVLDEGSAPHGDDRYRDRGRGSRCVRSRRPTSAWRRRGLRVPIGGKLPGRLQEPPEPGRRAAGPDRGGRHGVVGSRSRREQISAAPEGRPPRDVGAVCADADVRRARLRTAATRSNEPARRASSGDLDRLPARWPGGEHRRRATRHVLVGRCAGPLTAMRASPCLGRRCTHTATCGHPARYA